MDCAQSRGEGVWEEVIETMPIKTKSATKNSPVFGKRELGSFIKACLQGDVAFVKRMLKLGASPNILVESSGSRPLSAAAEAGHVGIVKLLLDSGADPNLQNNWVSMPPNEAALENAVLKGHLETAKLLVKRGADINQQGYWPPLKSAVSHGQPETVRYLLSLEAKWESSWLPFPGESITTGLTMSRDGNSASFQIRDLSSLWPMTSSTPT